VAETPRVKDLWEKYGKDGRVAIVGVNLDYEADTARTYVRENAVPWPNVDTQAKGWGQDNELLRRFGVSSIPSFWIIGADGKIVARDVPPEKLEGVVREAGGAGAP
jgi:hypothetical protein